MSTTATHNTKSILLALTIALLAVLAQSQNLFVYPYYQDVEGTNVANGISLAEGGDLTPYTYAYEEPPAGFYVLSLWTQISQPFFEFEFPLHSARTLMLGFYAVSILLVYGIAKKMTNSNLAAIISSLIFAFSPIVVTLQRTALLDNIMVAWLLGAFFVIMGKNRLLWHYFASAVLFAIAVLTKLAAMSFLPAFFLIILVQADRHHKRFAATLWAALSLSIVFAFPLYALMRRELFPQGWILSGDYPHVSLWEAMADRGPSTGRFLNIGSGLADSFDLWVDVSSNLADPILIYGGIVSFFFLLVLAKGNLYVLPLPIVLFFYAVYVVLGGQVIKTDIVPIAPFLALSAGVLLWMLSKVLYESLPKGAIRYPVVAVALLVMSYPFWAFYTNRLDIYTENQVEGQLAATDWIGEFIPDSALVVTDNYAFVELRKTHQNTHYFWKVDTDPNIKFDLLEDDLCNIDYLLMTPQVYADVDYYSLDLMRRAVENSELLQIFPNNGWPVEIRQVNRSGCATEIADEIG